MSDVYIDAAVVGRVRDHLAHIRELMEGPARQMREVSGSAMGAPDLVRRMDDFGHEWAYGIGKLAQFSGDAVAALDQVEKAFGDADASLAQALQNAAHR